MNGAGAVRGGPGKVRREAHPSIPVPQRRSTVAPFLQPSRSASSSDRPEASSNQQAFLFSLSRNATRFNQDDQQRPAMPERPLRATPFVGPLSFKCLTSRASEYSGCSAAAHPGLFDAAFKFTAATTSLRRRIHIDSDPGRPEAGR